MIIYFCPSCKEIKMTRVKMKKYIKLLLELVEKKKTI